MPALVIEGGGMKAAFANGVLSAFEEAALAAQDPWDAVYGTSAGGAMAAWYSAGQARYAEATWRYARDRRILSYRRALLRRGPLLDHEALWDTVYMREHPLDVAAVKRAPWPVIVTAADIETGEALYPDVRRGDTLRWLAATGRLPFGSGPPVEVEGRRLVDGGVLDPIPVRRAVADGHTDITVIVNQPPGTAKADPRLVARWAARRHPVLAEGILGHHRVKAEAVAFAQDPPEGVRIRLLRPPRPTGLSRLSRDLAVIQAAIEAGRDVGHQAAQTRLA